MGSTTEKVYSFLVSSVTKERLDRYLSDRMDMLSRSKIHSLIDSGNVSVNNRLKKPGYIVKNSDLIRVSVPEPEPSAIEAEDMNLDILFEDEYYLAVNKPAGIVVHPGAGHFYGTLVSGLVHYTRELSSIGGGLRPGLVHRLDKDTSGVILVAKSDEAHWKISRLFAERMIFKEYRAIVWGVPSSEEGVIDAPIARSQKNRKKFTVSEFGKEAHTQYCVLSDYHFISFLSLILQTGRTHQVRVHLSYVGHPILGDSVYGGGFRRIRSLSKPECDIARSILFLVKRQMLHAYRLRFDHPFIHKELSIEAPFPEDFVNVEAVLRERYISDIS